MGLVFLALYLPEGNAPGTLLRQGSGALSWRATDFAKVAREALGHHLEGCFQVRFPQEDTRQGRPNPQEFIARNIEKLQESRVMHSPPSSPGCGATVGKRRLPHMTLDSCSSWVFLAMNS